VAGRRISVSIVIDARPEVVWADLRNLSSHVQWMDDATSIRFAGSQHEGVGTRFECATKVGPFRLTDQMVVTEWDHARAIGIRHEGLVTGTGRFTLARKGRHGTRVRWTERLRFPWWMGGPAGAVVGGPVLKRVWRRNLRNLRARFAVSAR
jgi:carbon monoxide dehydrogenase subunit G